MLTQKEKDGIISILKKIPDHDLRSLAETMTNKLIRVETTDEAVNAVLSYAESALDVLKRRKIKKDYMFQYLHDSGHVISPTLDKIATIQATLEFWESKESQGKITLADDDDTMVYEETQVMNNLSNTQIGQVGDDGFQGQLVAMAERFVTWFYPLFNNGHVCNTNVEENFGPHHFWRDSQLKIVSPHYEQLVEGDTNVAETLLTLIGESQLYFNPFNAQPGIKCQCDSHGLALILVAGVVHKGEEPVGTFEQKFGLIRDPSADNKWKIKFSELQLCVKDPNLIPIHGGSAEYLALGHS